MAGENQGESLHRQSIRDDQNRGIALPLHLESYDTVSTIPKWSSVSADTGGAQIVDLPGYMSEHYRARATKMKRMENPPWEVN